MNAQDVAAYLQSNPEFFEDHAELLATVQLTSPHSHRAVSLQERQMEILREKNKVLELRLADLMRHGHDNDRTQQRMHAWQMRLMGEPDSHALPYAVQDGLQQVFDVPAVAIKLWNVAEQYAHMEVAQGASDDLRLFAEGLRAPYCGANAGFEAAGLLELDEVASIAMVALRPPVRGAGEAPGAAFGLLVLGSSDARRFHEGMGTAYLAQIGEVAGAALNRLRD
ncbi:hypothetical protein LMG23992_05455 [Cupriavidus laharis]|uniref:DUF484 family protein n=1 Tax=Cupriavidus laharis TaxID=151654 RepID=A0ABN7ZGM6_9BURK|nr:DUF484 family protein [Cupriavidus laharis]CAG9185124.1 hypothetical protein LMG23992_05455 [Cupriavidus laharis]